MKQETLEEAAKIHLNSGKIPNDYQSFIQGAKSDAAKEFWFEKFQQEQDKNKYSEDEVLEQLNILMSLPSSTLDKFTDDNGNITMKWFEQF